MDRHFGASELQSGSKCTVIRISESSTVECTHDASADRPALAEWLNESMAFHWVPLLINPGQYLECILIFCHYPIPGRLGACRWFAVHLSWACCCTAKLVVRCDWVGRDLVEVLSLIANLLGRFAGRAAEQVCSREHPRRIHETWCFMSSTFLDKSCLWFISHTCFLSRTSSAMSLWMHSGPE